MSLVVNFLDRDFSPALVTQQVRVAPKTLAWAAQGGPEWAELQIEGETDALWHLVQMLRFGVTVESHLGDEVWAGYVNGVEISVGAIVIGLWLDDMANSVAVTYTTGDGDQGVTGYLADADSVSTYGLKQLLASADNVTPMAAAQRRARELAQRKEPVSSLFVGSGEAKMSATLHCRGWFGTLDWQYYSRDEGRERYLPTSEYPQEVGLGFTGNTVAFEPGVRNVTDGAARLGELAKGDRFRISGSAANNGVFTVEQGTRREAHSYTASTLSFDAASREIRDSANGLGGFDAHDVILVSGSAANNGYWRVESGTFDGASAVVVGTITNESAGASITVSRGHDIQVEEAVTDEMPGAYASLIALGAQVAQSFQVTSGDSWTAAAAAVKLRKVGGPADAVLVGLYGDSGGQPGTLLEYGLVAAGEIGAEAGWVTATLSNSLVLAPGTPYWLLVTRTGAFDPASYYEVMVDVDLGYGSEVLRLHDGAAWVARPTPAHMPFVVSGLEATDAQMATLIGAAGEFIVGSEVAGSGVETNQWRGGETTALIELIDLLDLGTSNDRRLLAAVGNDRYMRIWEEPAQPATPDYGLRADGMLIDRRGEALMDKAPPVGEWVGLSGVIPATAQLSGLLKPAPFVLERAEYSVAGKTWRLSPRDAKSAWGDALLREG